MEKSLNQLERAKHNLIGSGSHKKISNQLKGGGVQPLRVLEILNSNGILTTDENKMDKIAREAWGKVFKGNVRDEAPADTDRVRGRVGSTGGNGGGEHR